MRGTIARAAFASLALSSAGVGCAGFPPLPADALDPPWQVRRVEHPALVEPSGLVASRRYAGVFWTHNDSGDEPRIFAVTAAGELLAELRVEGATHTDWEDITVDDAGNLYVGDFGNNRNDRRDLRVIRIPEPDPFAGDDAVVPDLNLPFRYADQTDYPDRSARNFDAEALFSMDGALHILTKHRSDSRTTLYRLPTTPSPEAPALEPIATLETGERRARFFGNVTAADWRASDGTLAVLTYRAITLYESTGEAATPFREVRRIELPRWRTRQVEGIAWDGEALLFGNEEGYLFRIPDPLSAPVTSTSR